MNKKERLQLISDMVNQYPIDTQDEIVSRLLAAGIQATQATVSRDIKALGIVKVPTLNNGYVYGLPQGSGKVPVPKKRHILGCQVQESMVHITVEPGTSAVVKRYLLDSYQDSIFSLIADDDSLLLIVKTGVDSHILSQQIEEL